MDLITVTVENEEELLEDGSFETALVDGETVGEVSVNLVEEAGVELTVTETEKIDLTQVEAVITEEAGPEQVVIPLEQETIEVSLGDTIVDRSTGPANAVTTDDIDIIGGSVGDILQKQPDGTYAPVDFANFDIDGGTY